MKASLNKFFIAIVSPVILCSCDSGNSQNNGEVAAMSQENSSMMASKTTEAEMSGAEVDVVQGQSGLQTSGAVIKIVDLVSNPKQWEGKNVTVYGEITKINSKIMGRNWIHLKDGSKDDFDLVVTTKEVLNLGEKVTLNCTVSLNKDFGAGYKYDLILENGVIVK